MSDDTGRTVGSQAEAPGYEPGIWTQRITGYQPYVIDRRGRITFGSKKMRQKATALRTALTPLSPGQSIADLGCSAGALGLVCASQGFPDVTFIDHDEEYLDVVRKVTSRRLARPRVNARIVRSSLSEFGDPHDIVLAFSLVHWVVNKTDGFPDITSVIQHLRRLTGSVLLVEWVEPSDAAIGNGGHLDGMDRLSDRYSREVFLTAMNDHFMDCRRIAETRPTRTLYAGYVSD